MKKDRKPYHQKIRRKTDLKSRMSPRIPSHLRRDLGIIFLFASAVFSLLSILQLAGNAGAYVGQVLAVVFGDTKIFVPFALAAFGATVLKRTEHPLDFTHWLGIGLLVLSFTAFFHLHYPPGQSFDAALAGLGGGLAGFFLADSLQNVVGFWGALVIVCAVFASSLIILFNTSLNAAAQMCMQALYAMTRVFRGIPSIKISPPFLDATHADDVGGESSDTPDFSERHIEMKAQQHSSTDRSDEEERESNSSEIPVVKAPKKKWAIQLSLDLLAVRTSQPSAGDLKAQSIVIHKTLENFGIPVEMGEVNVGPTVTQYTLKPSEGIKLSSIVALHNDLALALAAHPIRIEAPIPGKPLVGIEVPNQHKAIVTLREVLDTDEFKKRKDNLTFTLGKDVAGRPRFASIASMPHMLIAGSTGSGKTVCINTLIVSLLYQNTPDDLRFIMIDPKRVELPCYNDIPHLLTPVITDVKKALSALRWAITEMERRFDTLSRQGKRDIASYNKSTTDKLPYILIIIDELADIMVTVGNEAEGLIIRLAQMARAVGIHLILATQRPSVDVITGLIKANITCRLAFAVASQMDSRTILDTPGAEKLMGRGDMLYISAELSKPVRLQGCYLSDEEIDRVTSVLKESGSPSYDERITARTPSGSFGDGGYDSDEDDLLPDARTIIKQAGKASASLLQRRLRIGYARAARLLDLLEAQGFIGAADGARPREVLDRTVSEEDYVPSSEEQDEGYNGPLS